MKYPRRGRPQIRPETGTHKVFVQGFIAHLSFGSTKHAYERREHYKGIPQEHFRLVFRTIVTDPETGEQSPSRMHLTMPMPFSNNNKSHHYTFVQSNHFPDSIVDPIPTIVGKMLSIGYRNLSNAGSWQFGSSKLLTGAEVPSVFDPCPTFKWDQRTDSVDALPEPIRYQLQDELEEMNKLLQDNQDDIDF
jgi:hypothetical protein